jgi:hypothetical protein
LAAAAVTGCGDDNPRSNALRPPVPVVVTASISDRAVSISPDRLGAGPITLLITNQSNASQQVTLETTDTPGANTPGRRAVQTGPINPRETASVQAQVDQGSYTLSTGTEGIRPARLTVGPPRPSAQDQLGTP